MSILRPLLLALCATLVTQVGLAQTASPSPAPRIDIHVDDAPARAFFQGLVEGTPYNVLIHPEVAGRISLTLKHVTVEEALDAVRDLYGYDWRRVSTGYMILPATLQTRVFHLNYLDLNRGGISTTRISSGQVSQGGTAQYGNGATGTTPAPTQSSTGDLMDTTGTAVLTFNKSQFWKGIETDLKLLVGDKPDRNVVINPQSGVIVVHAMPNELRSVGDYLTKTEASVTRQVVLEAKIVEVELSDAYQAGVNWASVLKNGNQQYFIGQTSPPAGFDVNPLTPTGTPVTIGPGNPVNSIVNTTLGGAFTLAADFADFNAFIELLSVQGQTRVLSSPRVSTLNNQKAVIKAGSDEFFVTGVHSNTTTGTATSTTLDVEITPFFSGVALDVTPQVSDDNSVLLHIHPSVSEVTDQTKKLQFSGQTDVLPLAFSQIRESDSIVRAKSGQVIVIGGLMREIKERNKYKTPILGDIPALGRLFRSEQEQSRTVELVILLRPLVAGDEDWPALVQEPLNRADALAEKAHLK